MQSETIRSRVHAAKLSIEIEHNIELFANFLNTGEFD
jgi:hypothetical protein